jgi:predicted porin
VWNFGLSASDGPYFRSEAEQTLPPGRSIGDYREFVLGQDVSFALHHLQLWAEFYEARFEVPRVGDADTFAYYLEAKYKFTPQLFAALRWNQQLFGNVRDGTGGQLHWGQDLGRIDVAAGYRFTSHTQLKLQYSFQKETTGPRDNNHLIAAQLTVRF